MANMPIAKKILYMHHLHTLFALAKRSRDSLMQLPISKSSAVSVEFESSLNAQRFATLSEQELQQTKYGLSKAKDSSDLW
jgi:hypothetical protein